MNIVLHVCYIHFQTNDVPCLWVHKNHNHNQIEFSTSLSTFYIYFLCWIIWKKNKENLFHISYTYIWEFYSFYIDIFHISQKQEFGFKLNNVPQVRSCWIFILFNSRKSEKVKNLEESSWVDVLTWISRTICGFFNKRHTQRNEI